MSKHVLLLDADIIAYVAASVSQSDIDWGNGTETHDDDMEKAIYETDRLITNTVVDLEADEVLICLTDPDHNFRNDIYPEYKQNRAGLERPRLLNDVKGHLAIEYQSYLRPGLEADDIMGILQTSPHQLNKRFGADCQTTIVSIDKDMRTVPGRFFNPDHPHRGVMDISLEDANRFHMWQTIVGDRVDGYPGCPGTAEGGKYIPEQTLVGKVVIPAFFDEGPRSFGLAHEVFECDYEDLWDHVLLCYGRVGLTETEALVQARCAHILRNTTYDFKNRKHLLWEPEMLAI